MAPFLIGCASSLTSTLVLYGAKTIGRKITDPQRQALKRVFKNAFEHLLSEAAGHWDQALQKHIHSLLEEFIKRDSVASIFIDRAIYIEKLPEKELEKIFNGVGFDSESLPISFSILMELLLKGLSIALENEIAAGNSPLNDYVNHDRTKAILEEARANTTKLDQVGSQQETIIQVIANIQHTVQETHSNISSKQGDVTSILSTAQKLLKEFNTSAAKGILEEIQERLWTSCSDAEKSEVLGLLSRVNEVDDNIKEAIKLRAQAADIEPSTQKKKLHQAYLYLMQKKYQESFEVTSQLVNEAPNTPNGWNLWILSAPRDMTFGDIESRIPETVIDDANILACLNQRAIDDRLFDRAEYYARKTLEKAPNSPLANLNLALTILKIYEGHLPEMLIAGAERKSLEEAEELLRAGINSAGGNPPKGIALGLYANRAIALRMLNRPDEALEVLAALYTKYPEETQVVLNYARLLANQAKTNESKRILCTYLENHFSDIAATLLVELYLDSTPPDFDAVFFVAEKALSEPFQESFARMVLLHHCITAAHQVGDPEKVVYFLQKCSELPELEHLLLMAEQKRLEEAHTDAQSIMYQVLETNLGTVENNTRRYLARLLDRVGLHGESFNVWHTLCPTDFITLDTLAYLECAKKCGRSAEILALCERLRQQGVCLIYLYDIELPVLYKLNEYNEAINLTLHYLQKNYSKDVKDYLRFQLSQLGIATNRMALCERDVNNLPSVNSVSPDLGETVAKLLYELNQPFEAMKYAYQLHRRFPDKIQSHRAVVAGLIYNVPFGPKCTEESDTGAAIEYETLTGSESGWIILEDAPDTDISRNEYGLDHPLHNELIGKKKNDTFVLRPGRIQNIEAKVCQIVSKHTYRIRESLKILQQCFGTESGVEMISLQAAGSGEINLEPILREIDRDSQSREVLIEQYARIKMPITVLSKLLGKDVIVTMAGLHNEASADIFCCQGSQQELMSASSHLRLAEALVIDLTALNTLLLANAVSLLSQIDIPLIVAEGVITDLKVQLNNATRMLTTEGGLGKFQDQYVFHHLNKDQQQKWIEQLSGDLICIENICEIVGGSVALELPQKNQKDLTKIFSHSSLETIALGRREGHVLWSDDWGFYNVVKSEFGTQPRIWTQLITNDLLSQNRFPEDDTARLSAAMLELGYINLQITRATASVLMEHGNYSPDHPSIRHLLERITLLVNSPPNLLGYVGMLLRESWQKPLLDNQKAILTDAILSKIRDIHYGKEVIASLRGSLQKIFVVDALSEERCQKYIDAWMKTQLL